MPTSPEAQGQASPTDSVPAYKDVTLPIRQLQGFERVHLAPRETKTLTFTLTPRQLSLIDEQERRVVEPSEFQIAVGGRQPRPEDLKAEGTAVLIETFTVTGQVTEVA